jgi:hypothetical protein
MKNWYDRSRRRFGKSGSRNYDVNRNGVGEWAKGR